MTGPSSPIATWNHDRGAWETGRTAPCGHAEVYQPAWPKSGSMRGGVVSPRLPSTEPPAPPAGPLLPTATATDAKSSGAAGYPVSDKHRSGTTLTDAVRSMRLLPTPTAHDDGKTPEAHRTMERMGHGRKEITSLAVVAQTLLPTPQAHDGTAGAKTPEQIEAARERGRGRRSTPGGRPGVSNLAEVVQTLLPTPNARDAKGANRRLTTVRPDGRVRGPGDANLSHAIEQLQPVELLPTPVAGEARHGSPNQHRTRGRPASRCRLVKCFT
jgi:hypothetical protein